MCGFASLTCDYIPVSVPQGSAPPCPLHDPMQVGTGVPALPIAWLTNSMTGQGEGACSGGGGALNQSSFRCHGCGFLCKRKQPVEQLLRGPGWGGPQGLTGGCPSNRPCAAALPLHPALAPDPTAAEPRALALHGVCGGRWVSGHVLGHCLSLHMFPLTRVCKQRGISNSFQKKPRPCFTIQPPPAPPPPSSTSGDRSGFRCFRWELREPWSLSAAARLCFL